MPYNITTKDGITINNIPDDVASDSQELKDRVTKIRGGIGSLEKQAEPASVSVGKTIMGIPRQVGLTARYGAEGLAQLADVFTAPARVAVNAGLRGLGLPEAKTLAGAATSAADAAGLPSPQTADERTIADATRTIAGAGGMLGGASRVATATTGAVRAAANALAANPGTQLAAAGSSGAAGGSVREAGGGPWEQFAAALVGGVGGGVGVNAVANKAGNVARSVRSMLTPRSSQMRDADQQITLALRSSGLDWQAVPDAVKTQIRSEVAEALRTGQPLNADALRRLTVFRETGTTPTMGQLTQNPAQITMEKNLAKTGANSTDRSLQRLPMLENDNMATLLRRLDDAGAEGAPNSFQAGQRAIGSLERNIGNDRNNINALYSSARDTSGRSLPLEGGTFTRRASELLDEAMSGGALPSDVQRRLNAIASGEYPLTVASAEDLKTRIGILQRGSSDGTARHALGLVRQALDETPLQPSPQVNPGNLPAVPGTVPTSAATVGQESIDAFNAARSANRTFMRKLEGNPALQAVADGVEPDQFVRDFVIGNRASAANVRALAEELEPAAAQGIRQYIVRHLRGRATNDTDDITKFSNNAYRTAFRDIEQKLPAFFSAEEIRNLRNVGEAAKYMQSQPAGSAVNNSNSGALVLGRGIDMLDTVANRVPLVGGWVSGRIQGAQQSHVLDPVNALRLQRPSPVNAFRFNPLIAGVAAHVEARQDDSRN